MVIAANAALAVHDARSFFEKALQHGLAHKIIGLPEIEKISADAPRGMVQIARYFGSEFLRPSLEIARVRLVNLVSLELENASAGDVQQAAHLLSQRSMLALSKAGSDLLRAMLALPQTDHFLEEQKEFDKRLLDDWSLKTFADYRTETVRRLDMQQRRSVALWFAAQLGVPRAQVESAGWFAGPVIATALLLLAAGESAMPDRPGFEEIIDRLRKKHGRAKTALAFPTALLANLPTAYSAIAEQQWLEMQAGLRVIFNSKDSFHALFEAVGDATAPLLGQFVWREDIASEINAYDEAVSKGWQKIFGSSQPEESALLTYCLCLAANSKGKSSLSEKAALLLIRKIQKNGLQPVLAQEFLQTHAPAAYAADYLALWEDFVENSHRILRSDVPGAQHDALALLRRECRVD